MSLEDDLIEALDALELMVGQYLPTDDDERYQHDFMSAGESACDTLAKLRPTRWRLTPTGVEQIGDLDVLGRAEDSEDLRKALARALERAAVGRQPDPDHFVVTWVHEGIGASEEHPTMEWAYSAIHHWLAMGATRVEVHRVD